MSTDKQNMPQSKIEALKNVGFFRPVDSIILVGIVLAWIGAAVWNLLCHRGILVASTVELVPVVCVSILVLLVWVVGLVFRCMHFVLMLTAEVKLMPYEAARIVSAWKIRGVPDAE